MTNKKCLPANPSTQTTATHQSITPSHASSTLTALALQRSIHVGQQFRHASLDVDDMRQAIQVERTAQQASVGHRPAIVRHLDDGCSMVLGHCGVLCGSSSCRCNWPLINDTSRFACSGRRTWMSCARVGRAGLSRLEKITNVIFVLPCFSRSDIAGI